MLSAKMEDYLKAIYRLEREGDPPVATSSRKAEWFSPAQHLLTMLMVVLCPPVMRSRRLMWFWYRRPDEGGRTRR